MCLAVPAKIIVKFVAEPKDIIFIENYFGLKRILAPLEGTMLPRMLYMLQFTIVDEILTEFLKFQMKNYFCNIYRYYNSKVYLCYNRTKYL